jgi:hypothetical protein
VLPMDRLRERKAVSRLKEQQWPLGGNGYSQLHCLRDAEI